MAEVQAGVSEAHKLGVTATPTFVIGVLGDDRETVKIESRIVGAVPYEVLKTDLEAALAREAPRKR